MQLAQRVILVTLILTGARPLSGADPADSARQDWPPHMTSHWALQPVTRPGLPKVQRMDWVINAIDRFVLAELEKASIAPSPEADRYTLIRRVYLDLLGLPPSLADADAFVADRSPNAYETLVDRVLNSPAYGERWGRHW